MRRIDTWFTAGVVLLMRVDFLCKKRNIIIRVVYVVGHLFRQQMGSLPSSKCCYIKG